MRAPAPAVLLGLALVSLSGCTFLGNRGRDLGDCVRGRLGFGVGLYAEVEATRWMRPAVGLLDASLAPRASLDWDPRPDRVPGQVRSAAMPTLLLGWPLYGRHETQAGFGESRPYLRGFLAPWILMGNHHVQNEAGSLFELHRLIPNPRLKSPEPRPEPRAVDGFWLAASGTAVLANVEVGFNPLELLDFVSGWFGLDLLADDDRAPRVEPEDISPGDEPVDSARPSS